jgi:hypothetical protein
MVKDVKENNVTRTIDPMMFILTSSWRHWSPMWNICNDNEWKDIVVMVALELVEATIIGEG